MILINLLPYREERRKRRKQNFFAALGLAALVGALLVGLAWLVLQQMIDNQRTRNDYLRGQIAQLEAQIKDIATLREEIDALTRRQKAVEALQAERNVPVHLLNELARLAPEGIYFSSVKQAERTVTLVGLAQTQERVSELLRAATHEGVWVEKPDLTEIKLANVVTSARDAKRLFEFTIKLSIKGATPEAAQGNEGKKG